MRTRLFSIAAVLLLASGSVAVGQTQPAPAGAETGLGSIDFGFRGTSLSGDEARFERYRDLRNGANINFLFNKETADWIVNANAENIGYRDQGYGLDFRNGRIKASAAWNSIPLNFLYDSPLPWTETSPGVWALSSAARLAVQNGAAIGVPTSTTQLATGSIYQGIVNPFDIDSRRDTANASLTYQASREIDLNLGFTTTKRGGYQPFGASFAFNNANEIPLAIDNRTNDVSASLEWANQKGLLKVGWDGSWFSNQIDSLTWDNPIRATDYNCLLVTPLPSGCSALSPWDASGYSNGRGAAMGRLSAWPDNSMNMISATGLYKLPHRTTVNGVFSVASFKQNDTLIPWTTNQVILGADPLFNHLERSTAEAEVRGLNAQFTFNTRPTRLVTFMAKYRYNDHDNRSTPFEGTEYVRFDAVPEETGAESEGHDITRNTFDANVTFHAVRYTALRVGYTYDSYDRSGRSYSGMSDNTFRVSADTIGNNYVSLRAMYEFTARTGSGFSESALEDGGAQPGLRFYDESDRDRNRGTLLVTLTPMQTFDITASFAAGRDDYKGPGHEFGLLDNDNTSVNVGVNFMPRDAVAFGVNYGRDNYSAYQESRNANPDCRLTNSCPASGYNSWEDPNRTWSLDNTEHVNNFNVYLDLLKSIENTDVRFAYDYSDSDNGFTFGGPRIQELSTNTILTPGDSAPCSGGVSSCFEPLPNVTNKWHRLTADVRYFFTQHVGVGVAYWFEKFEVTDFNTISLPGTNDPRVDYLGILGTGYGNRPYKASTGFLRLIYNF